MAAVGQGSLGPNTNTDTGAHTNTLDDTHKYSKRYTEKNRNRRSMNAGSHIESSKPAWLPDFEGRTREGTERGLC